MSSHELSPCPRCECHDVRMCAEYGVGNIGDDEVTYYVRCPRCGNRSHGVTVQPRFTYHSGQSAAANEWNSLAEETTHV